MEAAVYLLGGIATFSLAIAIAIAFRKISEDIKRKERIALVNSHANGRNRENTEPYQGPHL